MLFLFFNLNEAKTFLMKGDNMKKIFFSILLLSSIKILAQSASTDPIILPQGYSLNLLNSKGTSGINNVVSNINFINPAALDRFDIISAGISYEYQTNITNAWLANIGYKRFTGSAPQSVGIILPFNSFKIGFGAGQTYESELDLGEIKITTIDHPDGIGETLHPIYKTNVYSYSFLGSYSIKNLLTDDVFGMGVKFSFSHLNYVTSFFPGSVDESVNSFGTELGLIYKMNLDKIKNILLGLSFSTAVQFSEIFRYSDDYSLYTDSSRNTYYSIISTAIMLNGNIPSYLKFDFDINTIPQVEILGSFKDIFWSDIKSNVRDHFELSGSMIYKMNDFISPTVGFYSTDYTLKDDYFGINKEMNAFYITAGLQININPINIDLALADSHWLSGEFRKQTIVKAGVGIQL